MPALLAVAFGAALAAGPQRIPPPGGWNTLERWVDAIETHEPGRDDQAVRVMTAMRLDELEGTFRHMWVLLDSALGNPGTRPFDDLFRRLSGDVVMTRADEVQLQTLRSRVTRTGIDRFLKRAAMLHTDVTLFHPDVHLTTREGTGHLATDGRSAGDLGRPWHYMLARSFLYLVLWDKDVPRLTVRKTEPDPEVLLWHQAMGNELWRQRNYTEALPHIRAAIDLFPDDAELQFVSGLIHESQSGAQLQAAVQEQVAAFRGRPGARYVPGVGSADAERDEAEDAFRAAIAADPGHLEARLHLAQVLNVDGKYDEALQEAAIVLEGVVHPWHRYFAFLFLGRAEEGRGHPDEARDAYTSASGLFPDAQSPRMAISQIDLRAGKRVEAAAVFEFLARERRYDADPWWQYDGVRVPDDDWLARLRAAFAEATR